SEAPVPSETVLRSEETASSSVTAAEVSESVTEASVTEPAVTYTCDEVCQRILSEVEFPSMVSVSAEKMPDYIDAAVPEGTDIAMYICGSGGFSDELFIMKSDDADIIGAAKDRIEKRTKDFEDYAPDEAQKLSDALFIETDGCFMYFVSSDNDLCDDIAREMLHMM
ncbi:MAG: DUF4358 domain-containing protein, partial [Oscillospiraceae bacterium]|nr:DUF4358 domain-containing protein [Oscillospiraceae bacterium]